MKMSLVTARTLAMIISAASAQQLSYSTSLVTESFSSSTSAPAPAQMVVVTGSGSQVGVTMPACPGCDCATCVHTSTFVTNFAVFCPHGTTNQPYTVTEVYRGMSSYPSMANPTSVPYGFTTALETCTVCGETPITATMTYPSGGVPYVSGMAIPTDTGPALAGTSLVQTAGTSKLLKASPISIAGALLLVF